MFGLVWQSVRVDIYMSKEPISKEPILVQPPFCSLVTPNLCLFSPLSLLSEAASAHMTNKISFMGLLYHVIFLELCDWPDLWRAGVLPCLICIVQVGHHGLYNIIKGHGCMITHISGMVIKVNFSK